MPTPMILQSPSLPERLFGLDRSEWYAVLLVACASVISGLVLAQGLPGDFILDDHARVKHADVDTVSLTAILHEVLETDSGVFGRVIPLMSLYLTKALYAMDTAVYKLHNIMLHVLCGLVIFWFVGRLLQCGRFRAALPGRAPWLFAAGVTCLWLLHPIQVSTALYIVQRMTQLSVIFTLLALLCYLAARQNVHRGFRHAGPPAIGLALFTGAGLLSKESSALIPLYIMLVEYFAFGFSASTRREKVNLFVLLTIFCAVPLLLGAIYFLTHLEPLLHDYAMRPFSLTDRLGSEAVIVWRYVAMLVIPRLSDLTLYHDAAPIHALSSLPALVAMAGWIVAVIAVVACRNRMPLATFGLAFFMVSHLLESTILPLELMFEHRNYIGSIGILLALIAFGARLCELVPTLRRFLALVLVLLAFGMGSMQLARASDWSDPYLFAVIAAKENPQSSRALSMLANHQARRGHLDEARGLIRKAIENRTHDGTVPGLHLHLLMFHCFDEELPEGLLDDTLASLDQGPVSSYALTGLKVLRQRMIKDECPLLSRPTLLRLESAAAASARTRLEYRHFFNGMAGVTSAELGRLDDAESYFREALRYAEYVSPVTRRETLVALTQVCLARRDLQCTDDAMQQARRIDRAIRDLVGASDKLDALEELRNREFPADDGSAGNRSASP